MEQGHCREKNHILLACLFLRCERALGPLSVPCSASFCERRHRRGQAQACTQDLIHTARGAAFPVFAPWGAASKMPGGYMAASSRTIAAPAAFCIFFLIFLYSFLFHRRFCPRAARVLRFISGEFYVISGKNYVKKGLLSGKNYAIYSG